MRATRNRWVSTLMVIALLFTTVLYISSEEVHAASSFTEQELFNVNDGRGYGEYRIPSIAVTSNGTVLVVAEARTGGDQTPTDLVLRRSTDGGNSFSANVILAPGKSQGYAEMNPMLLAEENGSRVHLLWSRWSWGNCQFFIRTSTDHGATWGPARDITSVLDAYKTPGTAKYFAGLSGAGMGPGHGFQMTNGVLVVPIYMTTYGWTNSTVSLIYSTDLGATWNAGQKVPNPSGFTKIHENMMIELSDGRLMTNMRNPGSDYRAVSFSNGVNHTWSTPVSDTELIDPVNQASLDTYDASRILFTNTAHTSSRVNMTIRVSQDDGASWYRSKLIYSGVAGYSDVAVGPDKTIYVFYEKPQGSKITLATFNMEWIESSGTSFDPMIGYTLTNRKSGKALDVSGGSIADGANVIQWPSHGGTNQQWKLVDAGNGYYKIINVKSGKALEVDGASTADGANVQQWTDGGGMNQQWSIVPVGSYYKIVNRNSGKVLEVFGGSTADGANVSQWSDNSGTNQQWSIVN